MLQALKEAKKAFDDGEIPVGAIILQNDKIIARSYNQVERLNDSTAHAEIISLTSAFNFLGSKYLPEASIYITVEPCLMCVGALLHARVREVVYGAAEPKTGALVSTVQALEIPWLNHRFAMTAGTREHECRDLMQQFFREKRRQETMRAFADTGTEPR